MSATRPVPDGIDVVLADGGTVHVRPIRPDDADLLVALHARLSPESIRYRYFAPLPRLSARLLEQFTNVDHVDREALIALLGGQIVAVGRYDRAPGTEVAEVAFVVDDAHQGRGLASVLLEHLAAVAAQRGIRRFEAEVLAENRKMVRVFVDAGYQPDRSYEEGVVHLVFPIEPTDASRAVMQAREHRSEARSVGRLLAPRSVAVVGAGRNPASAGHVVMANLLAAEFCGPVYPVNPNAHHVASVRAYPKVGDVPDDVDLAVLAVPAADVTDVIAECAAKNVRGLVVVSGGFSEAGAAGLAAERELVAAARANGMRVIGPNCLGIINTAADVRLNASLARTPPPPGRAGFFSQSGALGVAILEAVHRRRLGLSSFVSAGNRADVSGNDLLQYWEDDPATDVVLLHLESFGNARKFARLARRLGRRKPIVAVRSGGPPSAGLAQAADPDRVLDDLFRQAGVIRVGTLDQLFDVAQVLTSQPLPGGGDVVVVSNSVPLGRIAADACAGAGLGLAPLAPATEQALRAVLGPEAVVGNPVVFGRDSGPDELRRVLAAVLGDPGVHAAVCVLIPPLEGHEGSLADVLPELARDSGKPVVSTLLGFDGLAAGGSDRGAPQPSGPVPAFASPEVAVAALGRTAAYAAWRRRPEGRVPAFPDVDVEAARALVAEVLAAVPTGGTFPTDQLHLLLSWYGIPVQPTLPVGSEDGAAAAAAGLGYPVALKATAGPLRHRPELGTVRLDITSEEELRAVYRASANRLGAAAGLAIQPMAPTGVPTVIRTAEDPSFGAVVSFGVGGVATDLLGDRAFRILPLTDVDAAELVRSVRAAPLLFGYHGSEPVDVAALEQLLLRVARLADDLPEVAELELNPVVVAPGGTTVLRADGRVAVAGGRPDVGPRRLR